MIPLVAWKSKWKTFRQQENSTWEAFPNHRSIQPGNTVAPPSNNSLKWRARCQVYHCFVNCFHLQATLFERAEISELRMKNWVKTPSVRQLRASHKLKTSCCLSKWGEGQTIRCLEQIKIYSDEPAFSHLYWERCLIIKDEWYQTNSWGQKSYSWLESTPLNVFPLHPIAAVAGCCCSSSILGLWFLPETLPSGHPRLRGILTGWVKLKSGPQMLNRNCSTKSLPALTSLPRFLFSLSVLFPPNFPY